MSQIIIAVDLGGLVPPRTPLLAAGGSKALGFTLIDQGEA